MEYNFSTPDFTKKLNAKETADIMLSSLGWYYATENGMVLDEEKHPMPWYSYSAVYFLKERLNKNMAVFEFGSGFST